MNTLSFLLAFTAISALLFGYYFLFLRKEKQFQRNRFFLLAILPMAFLLPKLEIEFFKAQELSPALGTTLQSIDITAERAVETWAYPYEQVLSTIYIAICLGLLVSLIFKLARILFFIRNSTAKEKIGRITIVKSDIITSISSFASYIFLNPNLELKEEDKEKILQHEMCHIHQYHSVDVLFMEAWKIFFWFHPLVYIIDKEIRSIHEYQADQAVSQKGDQHSYIQLLLTQILGHSLRLSHRFFQNSPKNRIMMILREKNTRLANFKYFLLVPFATLIFLACTININTVPEGHSVIETSLLNHYKQNTSVAIDSNSHSGWNSEQKSDIEKSPITKNREELNPMIEDNSINVIVGFEEALRINQTDKELEDAFKDVPDVKISPNEPGIEERIHVSKEPKPKNINDIKRLVGYPKIARDAGIEGQVICRVLVDKYGRYKKHKIIKKTHPILVAAIEQHLDKIQFEPAHKNNIPVQFWVNIPFNFKLLDPTKPSK